MRIPKKSAGSEVMRLLACSSVSAWRSRTHAEEARGITAIDQHIDVGTTVRQPEHRARIAKQFGNPILVGIEQ